MNKLQNIEFDGRCKKTTAVIAGLLCALIALAFADRTELFPILGFLVIFAGDLCACVVITLYCGMFVRAFFPEQDKARFKAALVVGAAGEILKIIFLLLPAVVYGETASLPQILALIADIVLSRVFSVLPPFEKG